MIRVNGEDKPSSVVVSVLLKQNILISSTLFGNTGRTPPKLITTGLISSLFCIMPKRRMRRILQTRSNTICMDGKISVHTHAGSYLDTSSYRRKRQTEQRRFTVMFMLMFLFGLISFVTAAFHLLLCLGMETYKGDRSSPQRKKAWRNVRRHFYVTFLFFYLAYRL